MWYNSNGMIYGWYSAGYSLMELVASPDSPAMVTGDISGRNSVLVHIDGVETEEDASAITSITWSVRSPTGALMDYPLDPDIVYQSLPPLPSGRRLRFFEEGKEYLFFRFQIPQEMLTEPGAGAITPRFKVGEDFKAGTLLTYAVFKGNANDEDSLITKSQYDYLLAYVDRGITEAEGDERWVRLDPDGTLPTDRMQTITGDIRISSSDAIIPDSFLIVGGYNGNPALSSKKGRASSTTTLNLYPKKGTLSAPVVLNTPDEGGTLATREWVVDGTYTKEESDARFVQLNPSSAQTISNAITISSEQGSLSLSPSGQITSIQHGYGTALRFSSPQMRNNVLSAPAETGTLATQEWVQENVQPSVPVYTKEYSASLDSVLGALNSVAVHSFFDADLRTFLQNGKGEVVLNVSITGILPLRFILTPKFVIRSDTYDWGCQVTTDLLDLSDYGGGFINTIKVSLAVGSPPDSCTLIFSIMDATQSGAENLVFPKTLNATITNEAGVLSMEVDISGLSSDDLQLLMKCKFLQLSVTQKGYETFTSSASYSCTELPDSQQFVISLSAIINPLHAPVNFIALYQGGNILSFEQPLLSSVYLRDLDGSLNITTAGTPGNATLISDFSAGDYTIRLSDLYDISWEDYPD